MYLLFDSLLKQIGVSSKRNTPQFVGLDSLLLLV
jgi:hypothetical protein